jgi:hypothetical protein
MILVVFISICHKGQTFMCVRETKIHFIAFVRAVIYDYVPDSSFYLWFAW